MTGHPGYMPKEIYTFNERERAWLILYIDRNSNHNLFTLAGIPDADQDRRISAYFANPSQRNILLQRMMQEKQRALLDEEHLSWISKTNDRQCIWLQHTLHSKSFQIPFLSNISTSDRRKLIIAAIDADESNQKPLELANLQSQWARVLQQRGVEKWLDRGKKEALARWAWEYLQRNGNALWGLSPSEQKGWITSVLASFDNWPGSHDSKQLFFEKMKRAWSQQKYRRGLSGRKQYNVIMSDDIKAKLNALAKHHDRHINEILESIIQAEFEAIARKSGLALNDQVEYERQEIEYRESTRIDAKTKPSTNFDGYI